MSLIDQPVVTPNRTVMKAERLRTTSLQLFTSMLAQWQSGIDILWADADPQAVLDAFEAAGNSSVELFTRSGQLADFLEIQKPGCTAGAAAKVQPFTVVDGKILITVE